MGASCDGGGNRELSNIDLTDFRHDALKKLYPDKTRIPSSVCSIQLDPNASPWMVCPRRLLSLGRRTEAGAENQDGTRRKLLGLLGYPPRTRLGVWQEVKIDYVAEVNGTSKRFDYTFDYVIQPLGLVQIEQLAKHLRGPNPTTPAATNAMVRDLTKHGFKIDLQRGLAHGIPVGSPTIVEIMTSSTSGGNKTKRTTIPAAFEDALTKGNHAAPGINKRQVWARMASQLLVKSEVAIGWKGKCVWVLQDELVSYINETTGLNISDFRSDQLSEVNLLSLSYGNDLHSSHVLHKDLTAELYAGTIASGNGRDISFSDIIRLPVQPPKSALTRVLIGRGPAIEEIVVPN